jgi:prepilin-type N-terminal cleavage/methylation domain-containing protein
MQIQQPAQRPSAFSLIELLTVLGISGILASLLLAGVSSAKSKSRQTACLNNLHQIGLGYTGFALDHEGKYPMDVPERLGGSLEYNPTNLIENTPFSRDFHHFQALSNEVPNVKAMVCPADRTRRPAQNYQIFTNANLSYWVNTKAQPHATLSTLAGDWNVYNTVTNSNDIDHLAFTRDLHRRKGSVLFADGRVEITRSLDVEAQLSPDTIAVTKPSQPTTPTAAGGPGARSQPTSANPPPVATPSRNQSASPSATAGGNPLPTVSSPPSTNALAKSPSASADRPGSRYRLKRPDDAPESGRLSPPEPGPDAPAVASRQAPEDPEPWNTPGFHLFKVFAFLAYLISLLWALIALLLLYLRSRLAQRREEREQAAQSVQQE